MVAGDGTFTDSFAIPSDATSGSHQVLFWDEQGRYFEFADFDVTGASSPPPSSPPPSSCPAPSVSFTPAAGPVGTTFTITGNNWVPGGTVTSTLPYGSPGWFTGYQTPTVDANRGFSYKETVGTGPSGPTPPGTYTFTYVENYGGCSLSFHQTFSVTISHLSPPAAPSNLTVTAVGPHDIRLNWQDNSNNQTGFEINNGAIGRDVGANSTTYTWGGLAPGTYMCFKIRAYNSTGDSAWYPDFSPWYLCTTTPKPKPATEPIIYWSRTSGRPGTRVTLTGNGWVPGGAVKIHLPSKGFFIGNSSWHVSSDGSWKQTFIVADTTQGTYTPSFTESSGNLRVSGSFEVLSVPSAGQDWSRCHGGSCTIALDHARTQVLIDILNGTPKLVLLGQLFTLCNAYTYGLIRVACSVFAAGAVVDASLLAQQLSGSDLGHGVYITYLTIHFTKLGITPQR